MQSSRSGRGGSRRHRGGDWTRTEGAASGCRPPRGSAHLAPGTLRTEVSLPQNGAEGGSEVPSPHPLPAPPAAPPRAAAGARPLLRPAMLAPGPLTDQLSHGRGHSFPPVGPSRGEERRKEGAR
ncbi:zinc finger protein 385A-like [Mesoplodon densirostris]|uniref:zinc finger protein 385A-like n=1 Tax=Mesoplodon densirostris TaxID=48708 RepID=UPI0028DBB5D3|nr:zinc finger protein 385A-like [Mesoplodon densirostris]